MKTNITLKLDTALLREIRTLAAEEGISFSAMLTASLEQIVRKHKSNMTVRDGVLWRDCVKG